MEIGLLFHSLGHSKRDHWWWCYH